MSPNDFYINIRSMIVHEDSLLTSRTNWLLIIQGLLFAAFSQLNDIVPISGILAAVGIMVSISFFITFVISDKAIDFLINTWNVYPGRIPGVVYPPIIGIYLTPGFLKTLDRIISPRRILPWVFTAAWVGICIINAVIK